MTVACGAMVRASAALPSLEALSATMISASLGSMAVRQRSSHAADCQLTTRTETDGPGTSRTITVGGRALTPDRGPPVGRAVCNSPRWARGGAGTRAACNPTRSAAAGVQCHEGSIDADQTRPELPSSEITPESVYVNRRTFMRAAIAAGAGAALTAPGAARRRGRGAGRQRVANRQRRQEPLQHHREGQRLRGHHRLQQLLRVRHRQGRSGALRRQADACGRGR